MSMDQCKELELQLRQLQLQPAGLDRDRFLFAAGQQSVKRSWAWPTVAGLCLAMTVVSWLVRPPAEQIVLEKVVYVAAEFKPVIDIEEMPASAFRDESQNYLAMLNDLLENKPVRISVNYDSFTPEAMQAVGSLPKWMMR